MPWELATASGPCTPFQKPAELCLCPHPCLCWGQAASSCAHDAATSHPSSSSIMQARWLQQCTQRWGFSLLSCWGQEAGSCSYAASTSPSCLLPSCYTGIASKWWGDVLGPGIYKTVSTILLLHPALLSTLSTPSHSAGAASRQWGAELGHCSI